MEEYTLVNNARGESAIKVDHLTKRYNGVEVLSALSFDVKPGEMFGLIGPDGAGKTTLFRILATLLLPDSGSAEVVGWDIVKNYREIRKRVGYMPGHFSLYPDLSVEENLRFFATLFATSIQQNYSLIAPIYDRLKPFGKRKAADLSGGMKQKLALCCALIHKPDVLFLDEPTTGVDPVSRKEFWENLKVLQKENIAILVATPYMDEANLCDRIALMKEGRFLKSGTPQQIRNEYEEPLWRISTPNPGKLLPYVRKQPEVKTCFSFGDSLHVTFKPETDFLQLTQRFRTAGWENTEIQQILPGIEDCFMKYTQE